LALAADTDVEFEQAKTVSLEKRFDWRIKQIYDEPYYSVLLLIKATDE
jgi:hypothetical protein